MDERNLYELVAKLCNKVTISHHSESGGMGCELLFLLALVIIASTGYALSFFFGLDVIGLALIIVAYIGLFYYYRYQIIFFFIMLWCLFSGIIIYALLRFLLLTKDTFNHVPDIRDAGRNHTTNITDDSCYKIKKTKNNNNNKDYQNNYKRSKNYPFDTGTLARRTRECVGYYGQLVDKILGKTGNVSIETSTDKKHVTPPKGKL